MKYAVIIPKTFRQKFKTLLKKYHSLADDLEALTNELLANPAMGIDLGGNMRKVRMAVKSKNKGKSGGMRVITCTLFVDTENADIYLLTIYDKSERESISRSEIEVLKLKNGLR